MASGEAFSRRFLSASSNFSGPSGRIKPSRPSSSLSAVRQLDTLGLKADTEELRFDLPSRFVPPNRVPRLPSAHSVSKSSRELAVTGVLGISLRVDSFNGSPVSGSSRSCSKLSTSLDIFNVGGAKLIGCCSGRVFPNLIVGTSPKKLSSSSSSRNLSRPDPLWLSFAADARRSIRFIPTCDLVVVGPWKAALICLSASG